MSGDAVPDRLDEEALSHALKVACPSDIAKFTKNFEDTRDLRALPKAHLHIHGNALARPSDFKAGLDNFNQREDVAAAMQQARDDFDVKVASDSVWPQLRVLLEGDTLRGPWPLYTPDGTLRTLSLQELDAELPISGVTGWNAPDNLWHGMGGCREYNLVSQVSGSQGQAAKDWVASSIDARMEGIRWCEIQDGNGPPESKEEGGPLITDEAWSTWRRDLVAKWQAARDAVPEVEIAVVLQRSSTVEYAKEFVKRLAADEQIRQIVCGVGAAGAEDPGAHAETYKVYMGAGLAGVCVHVGEWSPERPDLIPESLGRMKDAVELGVKRIGHGIIAHTSPDLMKLLKDQDVALEVCL